MELEIPMEIPIEIPVEIPMETEKNVYVLLTCRVYIFTKDFL
jgi:hypothetical protein